MTTHERTGREGSYTERRATRSECLEQGSYSQPEMTFYSNAVKNTQ